MPEFAIYAPGHQTADLAFLGGAVDGIIDLTHEERVRVTEFPVDSGSTSLSDHAQLLPNRVRITGIVSDLTVTGGTPSLARITTAWQEIRRLMADAELVNIATDLRMYENMLIVSASAPRNASVGRALRFSLELQEIRIATSSVQGYAGSGDVTPPDGGDGNPVLDRPPRDDNRGETGVVDYDRRFPPPGGLGGIGDGDQGDGRRLAPDDIPDTPEGAGESPDDDRGDEFFSSGGGDTAGVSGITAGRLIEISPTSGVGQVYIDCAVEPDDIYPAGGTADQVLGITRIRTSGRRVFNWLDQSGSSADGVLQLPSGGVSGNILSLAVAVDDSRHGVWVDGATVFAPQGGTAGQVVTKTDDSWGWDNVPVELPTGGLAGEYLRHDQQAVLEWGPLPAIDYTAAEPLTLTANREIRLGTNSDTLAIDAGNNLTVLRPVPGGGTTGQVLSRGVTEEQVVWADLPAMRNLGAAAPITLENDVYGLSIDESSLSVTPLGLAVRTPVPSVGGETGALLVRSATGAEWSAIREFPGKLDLGGSNLCTTGTLRIGDSHQWRMGEDNTNTLALFYSAGADLRDFVRFVPPDGGNEADFRVPVLLSTGRLDWRGIGSVRWRGRALQGLNTGQDVLRFGLVRDDSTTEELFLDLNAAAGVIVAWKDLIAVRAIQARGVVHVFHQSTPGLPSVSSSASQLYADFSGSLIWRGASGITNLTPEIPSGVIAAGGAQGLGASELRIEDLEHNLSIPNHLRLRGATGQVRWDAGHISVSEAGSLTTLTWTDTSTARRYDLLGWRNIRGLPVGGLAGQIVLVGDDGILSWESPPTEIPTEGDAGNVLTRTAGGFAWADPVRELPTGGSDGEFLRRTETGTEWSTVGSGLPDGGDVGQVLVRTEDGHGWATNIEYLPGDGIGLVASRIWRTNIDPDDFGFTNPARHITLLAKRRVPDVGSAAIGSILRVQDGGTFAWADFPTSNVPPITATNPVGMVLTVTGLESFGWRALPGTSGDGGATYTGGNGISIIGGSIEANIQGGDLAFSGGAIALRSTRRIPNIVTNGHVLTATSAGPEWQEAPSTAYSAGAGLTLTGTSFSVTDPLPAGGAAGQYLSPSGWENLPSGVAYVAGTGMTLTESVFSVTNPLPPGGAAGQYLAPGGWADLPDGVAYAAGTGLTLTGTLFAVERPVPAGGLVGQFLSPTGWSDLPQGAAYVAGEGLTLTGVSFAVDRPVPVGGNETDILTINAGGLLVWTNRQYVPSVRTPLDLGGSGAGSFVQMLYDVADFRKRSPGNGELQLVTARKIPDIDADDVGRHLVAASSGPQWADLPSGGGAVYTAGTGLSLMGTSFSVTNPLPVGGTSGQYLGSDGWDTPPDTTYTAGEGLTLTGTEFEITRSVPTGGNATNILTINSEGALIWTNRQFVPSVQTPLDLGGSGSGAFVRMLYDTSDFRKMSPGNGQLQLVSARRIPDITDDSTGHYLQATSGGPVWVPVQDTDTTYTAGLGLTLTGTSFAVDRAVPVGGNETNILTIDSSGNLIWTNRQYVPSVRTPLDLVGSGAGSFVQLLYDATDFRRRSPGNGELQLLTARKIPDAPDSGGAGNVLALAPNGSTPEWQSRTAAAVTDLASSATLSDAIDKLNALLASLRAANLVTS